MWHRDRNLPPDRHRLNLKLYFSNIKVYVINETRNFPGRHRYGLLRVWCNFPQPWLRLFFPPRDVNAVPPLTRIMPGTFPNFERISKFPCKPFPLTCFPVIAFPTGSIQFFPAPIRIRPMRFPPASKLHITCNQGKNIKCPFAKKAGLNFPVVIHQIIIFDRAPVLKVGDFVTEQNTTELVWNEPGNSDKTFRSSLHTLHMLSDRIQKTKKCAQIQICVSKCTEPG